MTVSLHAAIIPGWLQILGAGKGWLDKAASCHMNEEEVVNACLIEDMLPFKYQIKSMAVHSQGAIEGVRKGVFNPDMSEPPATLAALGEKLDAAIEFLNGVTEDEMEGFVGQDMRFEIGPKRLDFTAEEFLMSFSRPNFYFHATTAYGVLRAKGVTVGKLDYLGQLRLKA
ncbi:hypothetical protein FHS61_001628 [Altererythrobacter atlanticus]|uniref:Uncharacterized protein n=1 Tax=Croceibacterium atlanticum TaxID=1267766 RepID=A0A0F7KNG0_9SPHN|nr:DUF1993 domain-containing protein [Croceibacterium atlanticum]AKH41104.1 hypothetical protein WYH_00037 [Croceibacterium atlanticum]MBB5732619.1 hypothetical protein [Croceibacterium atlanticum]